MWINRPTCWVSTIPQSTEGWQALRKCRISSNTISQVLGEAPGNPPPEEVARIILGLSEKSFAPSENLRIQHGVMAEPILREWHSRNVRKTPIHTHGVAVWKKDPRFAHSNDGEFDGYCIEVKAPSEQIYRQLVAHAGAVARGYRPPGHSHIFSSHWNGMQLAMAVNGLKGCDYIVGCLKQKQVYVETILPAPEEFENKIYKPACIFYDKYVSPMMDKLGIEMDQSYLRSP